MGKFNYFFLYDALSKLDEFSLAEELLEGEGDMYLKCVNEGRIPTLT